MGRFLTELKQNKGDISICNLYLGGAAHADDVRTMASSTQGIEDQGKMIANIATKNGLSLNESKTEIVRFSRKPLSARTVIETCVLPTLCYGAENWILDDISLDLLNRFQSELGKRILRLSRFHYHLAPLLGLSWPSMAARIHLLKLGFLCRLLSSEHDTLASRIFHKLASQDIYSLSVD